MEKSAFIDICIVDFVFIFEFESCRPRFDWDDVDAHGDEGAYMPAVSRAIRAGKDDIAAERIMSSDAETLNAQTQIDGNTLHLAVPGRSLGANTANDVFPNAVDHFQQLQNPARIVQLLLDRGANPNHVDYDRYTPLTNLCEGFGPCKDYSPEAQVAIAESLLQSGANPFISMRDEEPFSLHYCAFQFADTPRFWDSLPNKNGWYSPNDKTYYLRLRCVLENWLHATPHEEIVEHLKRAGKLRHDRFFFDFAVFYPKIADILLDAGIVDLNLLYRLYDSTNFHPGQRLEIAQLLCRHICNKIRREEAKIFAKVTFSLRSIYSKFQALLPSTPIAVVLMKEYLQTWISTISQAVDFIEKKGGEAASFDYSNVHFEGPKEDFQPVAPEEKQQVLDLFKKLLEELQEGFSLCEHRAERV